MTINDMGQHLGLDHSLRGLWEAGVIGDLRQEKLVIFRKNSCSKLLPVKELREVQGRRRGAEGRGASEAVRAP